MPTWLLFSHLLATAVAEQLVYMPHYCTEVRWAPESVWQLQRRNKFFAKGSKLALAVTLLTSIREVCSSNFGRDTDYPEVFNIFLQYLQADVWI
jgi:hypothetical protein